MCLHCRAEVKADMRRKRSAMRKTLKHVQQTILMSPCCGGCFIMRGMLLREELYSSMLSLLCTYTCATPLSSTKQKLSDIEQGIMDMMLLDDKDPGLLFEASDGSLVSFSKQPSESVRLHGELMMRQDQFLDALIEQTHDAVDAYIQAQKLYTEPSVQTARVGVRSACFSGR